MLEALVRRPPVSSANPPLLILLHGLGADERDLMGLSRELDPRLLVVCLRAPMECEFGGYAWFDVSWDSAGVHADGEQALASRDLLIEAITGLPKQLDIEPSQTFLGGFSQGAMMTLGVATFSPEMMTGAILMSGRILPEFIANEPPPTIRDLHFLVQHGAQDPVLPIAGGREVQAYLENLKCPMTYREYSMGHEISLESLMDLKTWLAERLD